MPIWISAKGVGELSATLNVFDLYKDDAYEKILGIKKDSDGTMIVGEDTEAPYVSVVFVADNANGKEMMFGLPKGRFSHPEIALNTTESGGTEPNTETLEGSFVTDDRGYAYMSAVATETLTLDKFVDKVANVTAEVGE